MKSPYNVPCFHQILQMETMELSERYERFKQLHI